MRRFSPVALGSLLLMAFLPVSLSALAYKTSLVPHTVYVGDAARLIVELGPLSASSHRLPLILDDPNALPRSPALTIHRIELTRSSGEGLVVLIDFAAYVSGPVAFPEIDIGGQSVSGLSVSIASILGDGAEGASPSPAALLLSAPGTSLLIYSSLIFLAALSIAALFLWRRALPWYSAFRSKRLRAKEARNLKALLRELLSSLQEGSFPAADVYSRLCTPLRAYLTSRSNRPWEALTPGEIRQYAAFFSSEEYLLLRSVFSSSDAVRFGALKVETAQVRRELEGVAALVERVEADGLTEDYGHVEL